MITAAITIATAALVIIVFLLVGIYQAAVDICQILYDNRK